MFVPREKQINIIEETFVLLKPDVSESHGILIDTFTSAGFSVTAKVIPRSQQIIDGIVKHFICREPTDFPGSHHHHASVEYHSQASSRGGGRHASVGSFGGFSSSGNSGSHPNSPANVSQRRVSLFSGSSAASPSSVVVGAGVKKFGDENDKKGEDNDDDDDDLDSLSGGRFARMRSHRGAVLTTAESPMERLINKNSMNNNNTSSPFGKNKNDDQFLTHETSFGSISGGASGGLRSASGARKNFFSNFTKEELENMPPTFAEQLSFIAHGTCMALVLTAANAVEAVKLLCGPENPNEAKETAPQSIRAQFGTNYLHNAIFCAPSHDVASELISLVFGYKTQQRTEVVRFGNVPDASAQTQQQLQQQAEKELPLHSATRQDLEEADEEMLSRALDAAIFGADMPLPPNTALTGDLAEASASADKSAKSVGVGDIGGGGGKEDDQQQQYIGGAKKESSITSQDVVPFGGSASTTAQQQKQKQQERSSLNREISGLLVAGGGGDTTTSMGSVAQQLQATKEVELCRRENVLRAREIDVILRERNLAESSWKFRNDGVRVADPPQTTSVLFAHSQSSSAATPQKSGSKPATLRSGDNIDASSNKTPPTANIVVGAQHDEHERRYGKHAHWTPMNHAGSRADTQKVTFSFHDSSMIMNQSINNNNNNVPAPAPRRSVVGGRSFPQFDKAIANRQAFEIDSFSKAAVSNESFLPKIQIGGASGGGKKDESSGSEGGNKLLSSPLLLLGRENSITSSENAQLTPHRPGGTEKSPSFSSTTSSSLFSSAHRNSKQGNKIDHSLLFESGSDPVKLKFLFEKFERKAVLEGARPDERIVAQFGRVIPTQDFLKFVCAAVEAGSEMDPICPAKCPMSRVVKSIVGRAAGKDWTTFDEFMLVLMKVLQM